MNKYQIVVDDPTREYLPGSLVLEARAMQMTPRGVTLLPVAPELFKLSGVGGYMKREWGAGFPLDFAVPRMSCPLMMLIPQDGKVLHWAVRLTPDDSTKERILKGDTFQGSLRLAADSGQANPNRAAIKALSSPINFQELGMPDADGGWTRISKYEVEVPNTNHYSFAIYGAAPGLRVSWAAISVSNKKD